MIRIKFKPMQVKCLEIENFIKEGILKFINLLKDEQKI